MSCPRGVEKSCPRITEDDYARRLLNYAADTAANALHTATTTHSASALIKKVKMGADGTPSSVVDCLVEEAILNALDGQPLNILSEEAGFIDNGAALTLVMDPVDGTANAATNVPLSCFSAALRADERWLAAITDWPAGQRRWLAIEGTTMRPPQHGTSLQGAALNLLRPHPGKTEQQWWALARKASRIRVTGCSTFDAAMVVQGSVDAAVDASSDTHRLVDLAAALVLAPTHGCVVGDVHDRPIEFDTDLTRRWSGIVANGPQLLGEIRAALSR